MNRREFIASGVCSLVTARLANAQTRRKVHRIGYLAPGVSDAAQSNMARRSLEAFRRGLRELGWVEGQNVAIEYRFAEGKYDRLPDLAAELVRLEVDVIAATTTPAAVAARNATSEIPIVTFSVGDPVGLGLVASLARPGGNVTGLTYSVGVESFGKQLDLLKQTVPKVRRVAVLFNPDNPGAALAMSNVRVAARALGIEPNFLGARGLAEFDSAFAAMATARTEALLVLSDPMFGVHREQLAALAIRSQLASMHGVRELVEAGGLMYYGPDVADNFRRGAGYVDRILRGAKPRDLPVQQPTKFEFVINRTTARELGLTIPQSLLLRADELIS